MAGDNKSVKTKQVATRERTLYAVAVVLLLIVIGGFGYSLGFLNENIFPAFSSDNLDNGEEIRFNLEGFEKLGL